MGIKTIRKEKTPCKNPAIKIYVDKVLSFHRIFFSFAK